MLINGSFAEALITKLLIINVRKIKKAWFLKISHYAENDNRSLSNCIETLALRYIEEHELVDEFEMAEINQDKDLQASLKRAYKDAKSQKGRFVK